MKYSAVLSASVLGLSGVLSLPAHADSWCRYEQNLIGTKAIGYVFPYALPGGTYDLDRGVCNIAGRDTPSISAGATSYACSDFIHTPVEPLPEAATDRVTGLEEYFSILVFEARAPWLAMRVQSGKTVWVETEYLSAAIHSDAGAITPGTAPDLEGVSLHDTVYLMPDFFRQQRAARPGRARTQSRSW